MVRVSPQCRDTLRALVAVGRAVHPRLFADQLGVPEGSMRGRLKTLARYGLVERGWSDSWNEPRHQTFATTDLGEQLVSEWREFQRVEE